MSLNIKYITAVIWTLLLLSIPEVSIYAQTRVVSVNKGSYFDNKNQLETISDAKVYCNDSLLTFSDSLKGYQINFIADTFQINVLHDKLKDQKRIISSNDVNSYSIHFFLGNETDIYAIISGIYTPVYIEENSFAVKFGVTDKKQIVKTIESIHKGKYDTIRTSFSSHGSEGYLALIHCESHAVHLTILNLVSSFQKRM